MANDNRNVLVTGGAGYIGSHAVRALRAAGYSPVILDNFSTGHREFVSDFPLVEGSVGDVSVIRRAVAEYKISAVMHFASFINVGDSVHAPAEYYRNNVAEGVSLIAALKGCGVRRFILSSTCAVYGAVEGVRALTESDKIAPLNPYAHAKRMLEIVLTDMAHAGEMDSVIFRYFNAAGAAASNETGEWHEPETHLIPNLLRSALTGGKNPLRVFGNDYAIPGRDGTAVRDYIHVADLADAHVRGLGYLESHPGSTIINLGTGNGASVLEVVRTAEHVLGQKISFEYHPRREGDAPYLVGDNRRAQQLLGWTPENNLERILRSAWEWEKKLAALKNRH
ncbi:MAG TPA: UDP-glucose 4-epimerase GalE [Turneriella sp.]|nr:UDP-glucose 4-epimerase GalE [Turneriella sp.]HNL53094.1 UDP-glucose 4-epimerase GalE [Turneriella sp.]